MAARSKGSPIDRYLQGVPEDRRSALENLRAKIHAVLPNAEECLSYGMPAFRLPGGVVAGFQATKSGCSYYPFSGSTLTTIARFISAYDQTKSALHFSPDKPLPLALVRKLLKTRIAEMAEGPRRSRSA